MFPTAQLHAAIAAVCPIDGVKIGRVQDRATWDLDPKPEATPQQIAAARELMQRWQPPAPESAKANEIDDLKRRLDALTSALSALATEAKR